MLLFNLSLRIQGLIVCDWGLLKIPIRWSGETQEQKYSRLNTRSRKHFDNLNTYLLNLRRFKSMWKIKSRFKIWPKSSDLKDYARHIISCLPPPDFQTFLHSCNSITYYLPQDRLVRTSHSWPYPILLGLDTFYHFGSISPDESRGTGLAKNFALSESADRYWFIFS